MNKFLLMAALTMAGTSAFASKARVNALLGQQTLTSDVQQVFEEPGRLGDLPDLATIEFGPTRTTTGGVTNADPNAEGGFIRSNGDWKYGVYLGHQSRSMLYLLTGNDGAGTVSPVIQLAGTLAAKAQYMENPLNLFFGGRKGDIRYGLNAYYASSERQTSVQGATAAGNIKKQAGGVAVGAKTDLWNAYAVLGLLGHVENNSTTTGTDITAFNASTSAHVGGGYNMEKAYVYGWLTALKGKADRYNQTQALDLDSQEISVGAESKIKSDLVQFYYGARLDYGIEKNNATYAPINKLEALFLPVYFGLEAEAASWLTLRASLMQKVLLSQAKYSGTYNGYGAGGAPAAADGTDTNADSTQAAAGASFKFNKASVDTVLTAGTTGKINTTDFGTQASLTYTF